MVDKKGGNIEVRSGNIAKAPKYILAVFCIALGFLLGLGIGVKFLGGIQRGECETKEFSQKKYKFISSFINNEDRKILTNRDVTALKHRIERFIDKKTEEGLITYTSVYYRDLLNGPSFGINEKVKFTPASLLKVPLMMAYLKFAEVEPQILERKLQYKESIEPLTQYFESTDKVEIGEYYTIEDLIYRMIVYSDNDAKNLLLLHMIEPFFVKVYTDLDIPYPLADMNDNVMNIKDYASFFRILFNAAYLNREMSEKALSILTKSKFKSGLIAGVPSGVVVAHKFGERINSENYTRQLHDCGIVYHKDRPYLLSVMTEGRDFDELREVISEISSIAYDAVNKSRPFFHLNSEQEKE
ncbi:MAG: serine hydrolase [Candidatus Omnitrophota bacterium]